MSINVQAWAIDGHSLTNMLAAPCAFSAPTITNQLSVEMWAQPSILKFASTDATMPLKPIWSTQHMLLFLPSEILIFRDCCCRCRRRFAYTQWILAAHSIRNTLPHYPRSLARASRSSAQPTHTCSLGRSQWQNLAFLLNESRIASAGIRRSLNALYFQMDPHSAVVSFMITCIAVVSVVDVGLRVPLLWIRVRFSIKINV